MNNFDFSLLCENGNVFSGKVEKVIINTTEGEITVLKNHIPLIATTKLGKIIINQNNEVIEYYANPGVLKINKEEVLLMSDKIEILK